MTSELTTIDDPAIRMYASPQAFDPVPGSTPQVGWLVVSVATASALQSVVKVGNDSCAEQLQPCSDAVVRSENDGFDAISETLPPHGGVASIVQAPPPELSASRIARVSADWLK